MNPDDYKQLWRAQSSRIRLTIDADLLVQEVQRNQRYFTAMIFWRDVREVGVSLLLVPVWVYLGVKSALPWTWYLAAPALLWIAGFMLADRMRHKPQPTESGEPLRQRIEGGLSQVDHQIWLLRNVFWWYLLPLALAILAFFGQVTWQQRSGGWMTVVAASVMVAVFVVVFAGIYWLNQYAVRAELLPRRQELEALMVSLREDKSEGNSSGTTPA